MNLNSFDVKQLLLEISQVYINRRDLLGELDSLIGDGDHGLSMERGAKSGIDVISNMPNDLEVSKYFSAYGRTFMQTVGGAIGPLFGLIFTEFSFATKAKQFFDKEAFSLGIINATKKIMAFGGAKPGDKTMVDVMHPLATQLEVLDLEKYSFKQLTGKVYKDALVYLEKTKPLKSKKGRSKFLGEKSVGHQDAGATSFTFLIEVINNYLGRKEDA